MSKIKLDKKKAMTIVSCVALATTLYGCIPPKQENKVEDKEVETIAEVENNESIEESYETTSEGQNDIEEYIDYLEKEIKEVESYTSDKWNSEECIQKREDIRNRLKTLIDFVFNGKEINGITFDELRQDEKERILIKLSKLDSKIDEYIPDYKERFKNWFENKSEDAKDWIVDKSVDLRELWEDYQSEVEEEYQSRKL